MQLKHNGHRHAIYQKYKKICNEYCFSKVQKYILMLFLGLFIFASMVLSTTLSVTDCK